MNKAEKEEGVLFKTKRRKIKCNISLWGMYSARGKKLLILINRLLAKCSQKIVNTFKRHEDHVCENNIAGTFKGTLLTKHIDRDELTEVQIHIQK